MVTARLALLLLLPLLLLGLAGAQELLPPRAVKLTYRAVRPRPRGPSKRGYAAGMENQLIDSAYVMEFKIGTPEQTVPVYIHSSIPYIAVFGRPDDAQHPSFNSNKSSTFKDIGAAPFPVGNGDVWATDKVTFGNESRDDTPFTFNDQGFVDQTAWGFSFPSRDHNLTSFWHASSANWTDKQLGIFLSRHRQDPKDVASQAGSPRSWNDSELIIGGINKDKVNGDIKYFPFSPNDVGGNWQVPLEGITVNGKGINMTTTVTKSAFDQTNSSVPAASPPATPNTSVVAILSVSSTKLMGPSDVVERIYENIPGAHKVNNYWAYPCNTTVDVRLTIGGQDYTMQPGDFAIGSNPAGIGYQNGQPVQSDTCVGAFVPSDSYQWDLGSPFLKNVYTAFRFDPPAVGFGELSANAQPAVQPSAALRNGVSVAAVFMAVAAAVVL